MGVTVIPMPAFMKPITASSWQELPSLAPLSASPAWEDTLRKVQSGLLIAVREYHFQVTAAPAEEFPDRYESGHAFWGWFDANGAPRLYRMIDDLPDNYDRPLAEQLVAAARADGIVFGAAG